MEQRSIYQFHLSLAPSLYTSLEVLTMPLPQLIHWLEARIQENPLLSLYPEKSESAKSQENPSIPSELDFEKENFEILQELDEQFYEGVFPDDAGSFLHRVAKNLPIVEQRDLFEYLAGQARETFSDRASLNKALELIAQIDERGYLPPSMEGSSLLSTIQTFDPPGIAARSIREAFMIQLQRKKSASSIALRIVRDLYQDLLHNRLKKMGKKLGCSQEIIKNTIQNELSSLSTAPASSFRKSDTALLLLPDLLILEEEGHYHIEIPHSFLPRLSIANNYDLTIIEKEAKPYFQNKFKEAKLLQNAVRKRRTTLLRLGTFLLKKEHPFFEGAVAGPIPLLIEETAESLQLHPSTISRAVANKVISTPRGTFPLKTFYRHAQALPISMERGISRLIEEENKEKPLSDAAIAGRLQILGSPCSRRTVAKYRRGLRLPTALLRRN